MDAFYATRMSYGWKSAGHCSEGCRDFLKENIIQPELRL